MTDTLSVDARSERMSRIRSKGSKPEMIVRRLVHGLGYRYRLHKADLPGRPDIALSRQKKAIFVHGCFWHRHDDVACRLARLPKSNRDFWVPKLEGNKARDEANLSKLDAIGWRSLVVWECQIRDTEQLKNDLRRFIAGEV